MRNYPLRTKMSRKPRKQEIKPITTNLNKNKKNWGKG
jgi:hypothetical protein